MTEIGRLNSLKVLRSTEHGLFLDGGPLGDILLPGRYAPRGQKPGDMIEVFLMFDSEDRLIATTLRPHAMVNEFAWLRVISSTDAGTFLDWGLPKDLFVPFREQTVKMLTGRSYMVRIYLDPVSNRIAATARLDRFLDKTPAHYTAGQAVDLLICAKTDLGYKAIVNGTHWGMIFHNKVFRPIACGAQIKGYIQQLREDCKIDLCLDPPGYGRVGDVTEAILAYLETQGGFMPVTDKTPPEEIYALFGISKKTYKQAVGALYKARRIAFEEGGTRRLVLSGSGENQQRKE
ncbi:MAG TPA: GntR family transcriptional regulator [Verrucomicrobia bacterium]|nr:GntR family transcriptional regulator [Verrucomicrobiota bacterium]